MVDLLKATDVVMLQTAIRAHGAAQRIALGASEPKSAGELR